LCTQQVYTDLGWVVKYGFNGGDYRFGRKDLFVGLTILEQDRCDLILSSNESICNVTSGNLGIGDQEGLIVQAVGYFDTDRCSG